MNLIIPSKTFALSRRRRRSTTQRACQFNNYAHVPIFIATIQQRRDDDDGDKPAVEEEQEGEAILRCAT